MLLYKVVLVFTPHLLVLVSTSYLLEVPTTTRFILCSLYSPLHVTLSHGVLVKRRPFSLRV